MKIGRNTRVWHPEKSVILKCAIGDYCTIHAPVWIGDNVIIGNDCKIQAFSFIPDGVLLGNRVFVGPHTCFTNDKHPPSKEWLETNVEDDVSIGANCTILPGVRIGRGAKIGAGTVVAKDVPAGAVVYGTAGRVVEA